MYRQKVYIFDSEYIDRLVTRNVLKSRYYDNKMDSVCPELIITEDSKAGFNFFETVFRNKCKCISAEGRTKVGSKILENISKYDSICAIVDGAAFGDCVAGIMDIINTFRGKNISVLIPESFEALLLGIKDLGVPQEILERTYDFCCMEFFRRQFGFSIKADEVESWEGFYKNYLTQFTRGDPIKEYSKRSNLKPYYFTHRQGVLSQLPELRGFIK